MMKKVFWICYEIQTFWVKNVVVMVRVRVVSIGSILLGFGDYYLHTMLYTYFKHSLSADEEKLFPLPHWIFFILENAARWRVNWSLLSSAFELSTQSWTIGSSRIPNSSIMWHVQLFSLSSWQWFKSVWFPCKKTFSYI